ncbi:MAG: efflux RND transporter permease subunit [Gammaproteobacteria bacterium]
MRGLVAAFARHRIAPNLLMVIMLFSGLTVSGRIEKRFFPEFAVQVVTVRVAWRGAAAEDVYDSVLTPLENSLRDVPDVKEMYSYAYDGNGSVILEFPDRHDIDKAADDVRRYLERAAASLPSDAEAPEISFAEVRQNVSSIALTGDGAREIQPLARQLEDKLARLDVGNVSVRGLPTDEIRVRFDQRQLSELGLTIGDVAAQIGRRNVDVSAGDVGGAGNKRLLRTLEKRQDLLGIGELEILGQGGASYRLGDIASIERAPGDDEKTILFNGKPAVEFRIDQKPGGSALETGRRVREWRDKEAAKLPPSMRLTIHSERWLAIESRMDLLLKNLLQGLVLVLAFLFLFLRASVAFWVAAGIPASFMVGLTALFFLGGSINMLTLFAFIMVTGIVVDDAIVVGENAAHRLKNGDSPVRAAIMGAREMLPAVVASSFTTVGAFMPLLLIGGPIGAIIFEIPLVVICVLLASVFECFLVLPGHLLGSFRRIGKRETGKMRAAMERGIDHFQEVVFRRWVARAIRYRGATVAAAFALLIASVAMFVGGAVKYRFFPAAELNNVRAQAAFVAGTPRAEVEQFAGEIVRALQDAEASFKGEENLLRYYTVYQALNAGDQGDGQSGDEFVEVLAELSPSEERRILASEFALAWQERVRTPAGVEKFSVRARGGGPPGEDLQVRLTGGKTPDALKQSSLALQEEMAKLPGLSQPRDDMAFGKKQAVFSLTPLGHSLGLTAEGIAAQLRDAFSGRHVQTFYEGVDEIDLRVMLSSGDTLRDFSSFRVRLPNGGYAALADVADVSNRRGFDVLQRFNARLGVNVVADVDFVATDAQQVQRALREDILPKITERFGVEWSFEGKNADERETVADMKLGLLVAAILIYTILAAVFSSWTFPLVIILTAPLSVIGAIFGHALMGYEMSILSAFGVFTLNGIVINDAIILVRDYLLRRKTPGGKGCDELITDTACRRFRAVMLTSLTTVGGLSPLMFETSTQAQFLIPMAISVCFGLMFATLLILFVVPAYMSYHESAAGLLSRLRPETPSPSPAR